MFQSDSVGVERALIPTTTQYPRRWINQTTISRSVNPIGPRGMVIACKPIGARGPPTWQHVGMGITASSIAHVRLTVSDIERSRQFYESVFGWPVLIEIPDNADEATRKQLAFLFGGVIYDMGGALIALRPVAVDRFHEDRCGLDHIAFRAADKAELEAAALHLDDLGIDHEPVKDIGPSYILEFRDPDNIALELTAPK
jgi:glyoxylase I family protein